MKTILITGSTGFLGSELIAESLLRGLRVVALARKDIDGQRVKAAVSNILEQKKSSLEIHTKQLICLDFNGDWLKLLPELFDLKLDFDSVYHIAANMSYAPHRVVGSFATNQKNSVEFYQFINKHFPETKNFFYVSTAYSAGINPPSLIKEELHLTPELINAYQMSKWAAEMSLWTVSQLSQLPLTIIRPSIIVGDRHTGRYSGKSFGFYMFIKAFLTSKVMGVRRICLDMAPDSSINIISIVDVVNTLLKLNDQKSDLKSRIIHLTCQQGTKVSYVSGALKAAWNFELIFSPPETMTDKLVDRQIRPNKEFAQFGQWNFEGSTDYQSKAFTQEELSRLFTYYELNFSSGLKRGMLKKIVKLMIRKAKRIQA